MSERSNMSTNGLTHTRKIPFRFDLLDLHCSNPERYPALIESVASDTRLGRYDILFAFPDEVLRLDACGDLTGPRLDPLTGPVTDRRTGFLPAFDRWWQQLRQPVSPVRQLPFTGGWFMLLGYELANEIEPGLRLRTDPRQPVAVALRVPVAVIRDRDTESAWIVAEAGCEARLADVVADLDGLRTGSASAGSHPVVGLSEENPARFLAAVTAAKVHIAAGDIYQANLSRQWHGALRPGASAADIYRRLRMRNPAPFAGLVVLPGLAVISSSPERLLWTDGKRVETRPIAGTRARLPGGPGEQAMRRELHDHPKERAEHVMLIDLERNDLGRICRPGSVRVDEFMVIESYAHVHHIVSNVCGELRDDATPGTIIHSLFPGGSITGCPKVRCMQIIHELENRPRGVYTGAMGYFNRDGSGDLNILIRTMTVTDGELTIATGSGIVADSSPQQELEETRAKARGMLLALEAGPGSAS